MVIDIAMWLLILLTFVFILIRRFSAVQVLVLSNLLIFTLELVDIFLLDNTLVLNWGLRVRYVDLMTLPRVMSSM